MAEAVELALQGYQAFLSGDVDLLLSLYHPDCEIDLYNYEPWQGDVLYRGHDGVRRFHEHWMALWDGYTAEAEDLIELEDDRVLVLARHRGRRRDSGEPLDESFAQLGSLRDGRIWRVEAYSDRSAALRKAGLA